MADRVKAKSRIDGKRPRVIVREQCDHDDMRTQQRLSHCNGSFDEAGYSAGKGTFGFAQTDLTGG